MGGQNWQYFGYQVDTKLDDFNGCLSAVTDLIRPSAAWQEAAFESSPVLLCACSVKITAGDVAAHLNGPKHFLIKIHALERYYCKHRESKQVVVCKNITVL